MAHKNLIDGTAYEIDGGKAMVDGTVYEIDHGKAMVDGTAYEVGFAEMATVKLTYNHPSSKIGNEYISIDGVKYQETATIEVPIGTVIYCYVQAGDKRYDGKPEIYLNTLGGSQAQEVSTGGTLGMGVMYGEYYYTVVGNVRILMEYDEYNGTQYSKIVIAEE